MDFPGLSAQAGVDKHICCACAQAGQSHSISSLGTGQSLVTVGQLRAQLQKSQVHLCRSGVDHIVLCIFCASCRWTRQEEREGKENCPVKCFNLLLPFPQPCRVRGSGTSWASAGLPGRLQSAFRSCRNRSGSYVEILQETHCLPLPMNEHDIPIPRCFSDSRVLVPDAVQSVSQNKAQRQF